MESIYTGLVKTISVPENIRSNYINQFWRIVITIFQFIYYRVMIKYNQCPKPNFPVKLESYALQYRENSKLSHSKITLT